MKKISRKSKKKNTIKKPGKWYYLYCDLYDTSIGLYIGDEDSSLINGKFFIAKNFHNNSKSIIKNIKDFIKEKDIQTSGWCMECDNTNNQCIIIFLNKLNINNIVDISTLVHECLHAALYITDLRDITQVKSNNEALAWLHEWIVKNLLIIVKKGNKK